MGMLRKRREIEGFRKELLIKKINPVIFKDDPSSYIKGILGSSVSEDDRQERQRLVVQLLKHSKDGNVLHPFNHSLRLDLCIALEELSGAIDQVPSEDLPKMKVKLRERFLRMRINEEERERRGILRVTAPVIGCKEVRSGIGPHTITVGRTPVYGKAVTERILPPADDDRYILEVWLVRKLTFGRAMRNLFGTMAFAVAVAGTAAYFAGYPPPQRFLLESQKSDFDRHLRYCEEQLSGARHREHWGDRYLTAYGARKRAELLCAEYRYRNPR